MVRLVTALDWSRHPMWRVLLGFTLRGVGERVAEARRHRTPGIYVTRFQMWRIRTFLPPIARYTKVDGPPNNLLLGDRWVAVHPRKVNR